MSITKRELFATPSKPELVEFSKAEVAVSPKITRLVVEPQLAAHRRAGQ